MKKEKALQLIERKASIIILGTVFLFPLFFNPYTANLFDLNKQILLAVSTSILLVLWMIHNMITKSFRITVSPLTGALALYTLISLLASISSSVPRTIETFIMGANLPVFLLLFFLAATTMKTIQPLGEKILITLTCSAAILGLLAILETVNMGPGLLVSQMNETQVSQEVFITPAGSAMILISFLIPALVVSLIIAISKENYVTKSLMFVCSALITSALVISAFTILPGKPNSPTFLPFSTSWAIAAENVKSPRHLLLGVGTNNYIKAFSTSRGVEFNQYEFWNTRFNVARNYPLYLFTTNGILGLLAWFLVLAMLYRIVRKNKHVSWVGKSSLIGIATLLIIILVIPQNVVLTGAFVFLLIALVADLKTSRDPLVSELLLRLFAAKMVESKEVEQQEKKLRTEVLPLVIGVPVMLLALFVFYGSYRVMAADIAFRNSLVAAANNNGTQTYEMQRLAIQRNPYVSNYHRSYASTNLALANSIGSQENPPENAQATISTLIRQAIREGQNAVRINPDNPANWEVLAGIYRNLINAADGATEWAISSYAQAINLDKTNPRLWLDVGGIFFQLQNYGQAIEAFQRAAALKPDWANAHYNLANAYAKNQELKRAIAEYDLVLSLVDASSADYSRAIEEQNKLKTQLGEAETQAQPQTAELTDPEPLPTPLPGAEAFELTDEDAPPQGDENATEKAGFGDVIGNENEEEATPSAETN